MNKRRLALVARKLESLPPRRFNFNYWVGHNWKGAQDLSCGAPACAMGWAATLPSLQKAGLRIKRDPDADVSILVTLRGRTEYTGGVHPSLRAAMKVFELDEHEAMYLFTPESSGLDADASAKDVAAHIRKFIEDGKT